MPSATEPPSLSKSSGIIPKLVPRKRTSKSAQSQPDVKTPPLPPPLSLSGLKYVTPSRRILSPTDHEVFKSSKTYDLIVSFILTLADSVRDTPISACPPLYTFRSIQSILTILDNIEVCIDEATPDDQGDSRFGNKAFRIFLDVVSGREHDWHRETLEIQNEGAARECGVYFMESFGNSTRIDYGSGHELNFMMWLLCLYQLHVLPAPAFPSLVLLVYPRYLKLMRHVQSAYYLEPAGSHGVWGLDDYQFLPFLFGASQLFNHPYIRPLSIHNQPTLEEYSSEYLYLDQVAHINATKNVEGLRWHSPMLDDISAAKNWAKVDTGMRRMFLHEVLGKLPVMQHFLFGSLIPAAEGMSGQEQAGQVDQEESVETDGMKHVHHANAWGDCCGIKVPSSISAVQETQKHAGGASELRRIPFD